MRFVEKITKVKFYTQNTFLSNIKLVTFTSCARGGLLL